MESTSKKEIVSMYAGDVEIHYWASTHWYKDKEGNFLSSASKIAGLPDKGDVMKYWACNEMANSILSGFFGENINVKALAENLEDPLLDRQVTVTIKEIIASRMAWRNKQDTAKDVGTQVHEYCENFARAMMKEEDAPEIPKDIPEQVLNGINGFIEWVTAHDVEFKECEIMLYSKKHNYVGRTDVIASVDGKLLLLDYKTANDIYDEHKDQVCGYLQAYNEEKEYIKAKTKQAYKKLEGAAIIQFNKDNGEFHYVELQKEEIKLCTAKFLALNEALKTIKAYDKFKKENLKLNGK